MNQHPASEDLAASGWNKGGSELDNKGFYLIMWGRGRENKVHG